MYVAEKLMRELELEEGGGTVSMAEMKPATFNDDLAPDAHTLSSVMEIHDRSLYINHLKGKCANETMLSAKTLERIL